MVNPGYPPPGYAQPPPPQGNGLAVAGMVLGIIALVLFWIPFLNWLLALLAIIFGAIGLAKARSVGGRGKGAAIAGLVCGVLGAVAGIVLVVVATTVIKKGVDEAFKESKVNIADITVHKYADEAFPQWAAAHTDKACPATIDQLNEYMDASDTRDPWGHKYKMMCGANLPHGATGIAVLSMGPDGVAGTADDIKSWP